MGGLTELLTLNKTQGSAHKVTCTHCAKPTEHKVVQSVEKRTYSMYGAQRYSEYQIIQCEVCSTLSFRQQECNSEEGQMLNSESGACFWSLYPERQKPALVEVNTKS
ncbi:MAG: hypothetical protein AAGB12_02060 [Pseudomonadota bacterium]